MIIGYDNKYRLATLTASDENPAFPVENSQDTRLSRLFKTTGTDVDVSGLNGITATSFFLANHNLSSSADVYLKGNSDNNFAFPKLATHTLTNKVTIDCIVEPTFAYDTSSFIRLLSIRIDSDSKLIILWNASTDLLYIAWQDNGNERTLLSQQFDDGTSHTNINQRIRLTATLDLSSGGINDSTFRVEPLEAGSTNTDASWSGTPDILSSTINNLYIGQSWTLGDPWQGNIEYLNIYDNQLLTYSDIDTGNYTPDFSEVNYPITYASGIMHRLIDSQTHPYWRLDIDDSTNTEGIIKYGSCFLGTYLSLTNFSHVLTVNDIDTTTENVSLSGQRYRDVGYIFKTYDLNFPRVTQTEKENLIAFKAANRKKPVYIMLDETSTSEFSPIYGTIEDISYSRVFNNFYTISMKINEAK